MRSIGLSRSVLLLFCALALTAQAQPRGPHEGGPRPHGVEHPAGPVPEHRWHGDIHQFHVHDLPHWRSGHWAHVEHEGRLGWWWVIGDAWYFYPAPIYPYPDPYTPPVYSSPATPPPAGGNMPQYWYYCASSGNYYPYISTCPEGWKMVPATPAQ